jgi:hypothetical protein
MLKKIDLNDISVEFKSVKSTSIYCLFHRRYNVIVDNYQVEIDDCLIAYSNDVTEILEYRAFLVEKDNYLPIQLYIRLIPNIFYY